MYCVFSISISDGHACIQITHSDIETIDKNLADSLGSFLECALNAAAVVAVVATHAPFLLLGLLPLLALAAWVARAYLACSRELKRLEAVSRSPIYSHFSETVGGLSVVVRACVRACAGRTRPVLWVFPLTTTAPKIQRIPQQQRAYGVQDQFVVESQQRVDKYSRVDFFLWTANRYVGLSLVQTRPNQTSPTYIYEKHTPPQSPPPPTSPTGGSPSVCSCSARW